MSRNWLYLIPACGAALVLAIAYGHELRPAMRAAGAVVANSNAGTVLICAVAVVAVVVILFFAWIAWALAALGQPEP